MEGIDLDEIRAWMRECGAIARQHFNHVTGHRKTDRSWVTEADVAIEQWLAERLAARYPHYGIIGEEQTKRALDREFLWALDPIDGTASFVAGLPTWSISLGLLRAGLPYFGVIYLPLLEDLYWAGPEGPAFLNERPIQVAPPREWETEDWLSIPSNAHRRFRIDFIGKTRTLGSTAASFCYVARGSALGTLLSRASIWDIAAGLAIVRAAGSEVSGLSGTALDTTTMLGDQQLAEPIIVAAPAHLPALREHIHWLAPA
jgi:myo-inositol-1(or 4)-monophosphatase